MNEDSRHRLAMGVDVGCPDLIILGAEGRILFMELKTKSGKLSASQIKWNQEFDLVHKSDTCNRYVAYGYDEAIAAIDSWLNHQPILPDKP